MAEVGRVAVGATVQRRVQDRMDELSAGERKVARTLLATYPAAGLESAADLAKRANVSTPTVLRFVTRLGYQGYPDFQRVLIREVHERMGSPLAQYDEQEARRGGQQFLPYVSSTFVGTVKETFDNVPRHDFLRAVDLLADSRRQIRLIGGRFSHVLAEYLAAHLHIMRTDVMCLTEGGMARAGALLDASRKDVFVVFDYRRYQPATIELATAAAAAGASVVLLTDQYLSPIADIAEAVLPARVDAPSPFDSLVPAMALVESLVAGVSDKLGDTARKRVRRLEELRPDAGESIASS
ncbi:MurR/RpiR family transcriptional regulator [Phytohabitans aurantiacus]|jgi:DNA-binding MurR/RpiR family transcriptional regulator|uniref:Sugar isomerase n=1 Tax=Phytohabitans aurantiacus TaxID=3016789 RepID=A0ABQ5R6H1_9ACTN|nr:MurR/RpiR family transcriptional regulator [Phytohabitans aurantiacus]GLI01777.1 sugar isomerase [Phytohabitans aurantiacus]